MYRFVCVCVGGGGGGGVKGSESDLITGPIILICGLGGEGGGGRCARTSRSQHALDCETRRVGTTCDRAHNSHDPLMWDECDLAGSCSTCRHCAWRSVKRSVGDCFRICGLLCDAR